MLSGRHAGIAYYQEHPQWLVIVDIFQAVTITHPELAMHRWLFVGVVLVECQWLIIWPREDGPMFCCWSKEGMTNNNNLGQDVIFSLKSSTFQAMHSLGPTQGCYISGTAGNTGKYGKYWEIQNFK